MIITDSKKIIVNFSVLLYFTSLSLVNQFSVSILYMLFYISLLMCASIGLLTTYGKSLKKSCLVLALLLISGALGIVNTNNIPNNYLVYLIFYFFASFSFSNKNISEKTLLFAILLNAAIIIGKYLTVGIYGRIFVSGSNNFVSVYLMYPTVIYYSIVSKNRSDVKMFPILIVWVLTLLARGRGGIISVTLFLVMVYYLKYKSMRSSKKIIINIFTFLTVAVLVLNISTIINMIGSSVIMEQFNERGGFESSRTRFWAEYINHTFSDVKNFLYGTDVSKLFIGRELDGNPHNSLIEIHMLNGMLGLSIVIVLLINNVIKSLKNENYLFCFCMFFLLIRGFTDHVLWNAYGTPVLFFFMFFDTKPVVKKEELLLSICQLKEKKRRVLSLLR